MKTLFDDDMPRNVSVIAKLIGGPFDSEREKLCYRVSQNGTIEFLMPGHIYDYESPGVYRYREPVGGGRVRTGRPFATLTPNGAIRPSVSVDADF